MLDGVTNLAYNWSVGQDISEVAFFTQSTRPHNLIVAGKEPQSCYLAVLTDSVDARLGLFVFLE